MQRTTSGRCKAVTGVSAIACWLGLSMAILVACGGPTVAQTFNGAYFLSADDAQRGLSNQSPTIATDGTNWIAAWWSEQPGILGSGFGSVQVGRSTENGSNWQLIANGRDVEHPLSPGTVGPATLRCGDWQPGVVAGPPGEFVIVWSRQVSGTSHLFASKSTDGGLTWSAERQLTTALRNECPRIAYGLDREGGSGRWMVVWAAYTGLNIPQSNVWDIHVARLTDDPATLALTDEAALSGGANEAHLYPSIATDRAGHWLIAWSVDQFGHDVMRYAYSSDLSLAWTIQNIAGFTDLACSGDHNNTGSRVAHVATDGQVWSVVWQATQIRQAQSNWPPTNLTMVSCAPPSTDTSAAALVANPVDGKWLLIGQRFDTVSPFGSILRLNFLRGNGNPSTGKVDWQSAPEYLYVPINPGTSGETGQCRTDCYGVKAATNGTDWVVAWSSTDSLALGTPAGSHQGNILVTTTSVAPPPTASPSPSPTGQPSPTPSITPTTTPTLTVTATRTPTTTPTSTTTQTPTSTPTYTPACVGVPAGTSCDDGLFCNGSDTCDGLGQCAQHAGSPCDDADACTTDSCNEAEHCQHVVAVESRACGSCGDAIDNDSDEDVDADDSGCATLSEAQHFALIGRIAKGKSVVLGGGVSINSNQPGSHDASAPPFPSGQSRGGVCSNQAQIITSVQIAGAVAAADGQKVRFGTGQDINIGTTYAVGPTTKTVLTGVAPVVGPGACSDAGMTACTLDAQCVFPTRCEGLLLDDPANLNVDKTGVHEEFVRCGEAKGAMAADEASLFALPVSTPAFNIGPIKHQIAAAQPLPILSGPGPHILRASQLRVAPGATLVITADDPDAVVLIQVEKAISIGKTATVQVGGMLKAQNLLWVAHGKGSVKINGGATFVGTVLAPDRSVKLGQNIYVDGALIGNKVSISGACSVTHLPFTALL